jgi:hypothetical protein
VDKLVERRSGKAWRSLYKTCMTDEGFRNREIMAPGYVQAMMVLSVSL